MATDSRPNTHHDVLWDGKTLYVASYKFVDDGLPAEPGFPTTMRRYSYDSSAKKYTLLGSSQINNSKIEVLTIDKDSTGRIWSSWQQDNRIYVNVTATDGKTWGTPFQLPGAMSNVSVDDTSAVIAFDGKIGVMWSRQMGDSTDGMYWSYHVDGASATTWSTPVAAVSGQRSSDDHMNLKWLDSSGGRVFAAIKTSYISASQPLIELLALSGTSWSAHTIATVAECPNRVIVMIDESTQRLRTFATYPKPSGTTDAGVCTTSGGAIYEKSTPLDNINFTTTKTARIVDADQFVHNVTSTKQNVNSAAGGTANSGLLVLADVNATKQYWHYYDPTGGGGSSDATAPTVTATSPAAGATGVSVTANVTGTFSEAMDPSTITSGTFTLTGGTAAVTGTVTYGATGKVATLDPGADLAAGTTYTATLKGGSSGVKDVAGNALAADKTWTFTTAGTATSQTPIAVKAASLNGALGAATTPEVYGLRDNGGYQCFERGCILYSPASGAHVSAGPIRSLWAATGFENGSLGYPVTDEVGGLKDGGVFQNYQGGAIIWSPATGAHISIGAIRSLWAATGFENGRLGYPVTDEVGGLKDGGVFQNYQGGAIIWSPATGAHISVGAIRSIWASTGYESGRLGYPTSDEYATGGDGGVAQNYQGGVIHVSRTGSYITWI